MQITIDFVSDFLKRNNTNSKRKAIMNCFVEKNYICIKCKILIKNRNKFANFYHTNI